MKTNVNWDEYTSWINISSIELNYLSCNRCINNNSNDRIPKCKGCDQFETYIKNKEFNCSEYKELPKKSIFKQLISLFRRK